MEHNKYTEGVDFDFLKAMEVEVVEHQPWQLGLFYPDLDGKFVWYPKKGTLMYQREDENGAWSGYKIHESVTFKGEDPEATENVVNEIMIKVKEQEGQTKGFKWTGFIKKFNQS